MWTLCTAWGREFRDRLRDSQGFLSPSLQDVLRSIASAFLYYVNHFKLYSSFCASHSKAQKALNPSEYIHVHREDIFCLICVSERKVLKDCVHCECDWMQRETRYCSEPFLIHQVRGETAGLRPWFGQAPAEALSPESTYFVTSCKIMYCDNILCKPGPAASNFGYV